TAGISTTRVEKEIDRSSIASNGSSTEVAIELTLADISFNSNNLGGVARVRLLPRASVPHRLLPERIREQVQAQHQAHQRQRRRQGRVDVDAQQLAPLVDRGPPIRALRAHPEPEEAERPEQDGGVADPEAGIDD